MILGAVCVILLITTIGLAAYYVPLSNNLNDRIQKLDDELATKERTINDLNTTVSNLTLQLNAQGATISNLTSQLANLGERNSNLNKMVNNQTQTIDRLNGQILQLQTQQTDLTSQITGLNTQIASLNIAVDEQNLTIQSQSAQISDLLSQLADLRSKEKAASNEIDFSFHVHDFDNNTIPLMRELGVQWVRLDWAKDYNMTYYLSEFAKNNIEVLCIVDNWSVDSFTGSAWNESLTNIVNSSGASYVSAWEIWNEPNRDMNASQYYQLLKSAYTIIKNQSNPQLVVSAGLAAFGYPNLEFYQELYSYNDTKQYLDYQGVHPYFDVAPSNLEYIENVSAIIGDVRMWATETGIYSIYPYNETYQAQYIVTNWNLLHNRVDRIFWYEFKDYEAPFTPESERHFGAITINDERKPSFFAFEGLTMG